MMYLAQGGPFTLITNETARSAPRDLGAPPDPAVSVCMCLLMGIDPMDLPPIHAGRGHKPNHTHGGPLLPIPSPALFTLTLTLSPYPFL